MEREPLQRCNATNPPIGLALALALALALLILVGVACGGGHDEKAAAPPPATATLASSPMELVTPGSGSPTPHSSVPPADSTSPSLSTPAAGSTPVPQLPPSSGSTQPPPSTQRQGATSQLSADPHADRLTPEWRGFYSHPASAPQQVYGDHSDLLTGLIIEVRWSDLEPEPGHFEMDKLVSQVKKAASLNAKVGIRVWAGQYIPDWLCTGPEAPQCVDIPVGADATVKPAALPWDQRYQDQYDQLVKQVKDALVSADGEGLPDIYWVNVGAGFQFNEMSVKANARPYLFAGCPAEPCYTQDKYVAAWLAATDSWSENFPEVPILVHLDSAPQNDAALSNNLDVAGRVADGALARWGRHVWFGSASLSSQKQPGFFELFGRLAQQTAIGLQIRAELVAPDDGQADPAEYEAALEKGLELPVQFIAVRREEVEISQLASVTRDLLPCLTTGTACP